MELIQSLLHSQHIVPSFKMTPLQCAYPSVNASTIYIYCTVRYCDRLLESEIRKSYKSFLIRPHLGKSRLLVNNKIRILMTAGRLKNLVYNT